MARSFDKDHVDEGPSRSELEYGEDWKKRVLDEGSLRDQGILLVYCPFHPHHLMTPIAVRGGHHGDNVTLQCHYKWTQTYDDENGDAQTREKSCNLLGQFWKELNGYFRPGDILGHESWIHALQYIQKANNEVTEQQKTQSKFQVKEAPPRPWSRAGTVRSQVFDYFWSQIMERGQCSLDDLKSHWIDIRGANELDKLYNVTRDKEEPLTKWMKDETGYIIKFQEDEIGGWYWTVEGKK